MSKICILIVEDDFLIRFGMSYFLQDNGFEVYEAKNADIALLILETNGRIQIIFMEADMPGSMDGLKLSAAIRNRWPPVKFVVTSGRRLVTPQELPDGSLFFSKPYDHAQIAMSLRNLAAA